MRAPRREREGAGPRRALAHCEDVCAARTSFSIFARLLARQGGNGGVVGFFFSFLPTEFEFLAVSQVSGNLRGKLMVYSSCIFL